MEIVKRYYKEILFFGSYLAVLLICMSPDVSVKAYGNDGYSIFYGGYFLEARYPSPVHTFLGYPASHLPFGNPAGNMVLFLSVLPAFVSSILVFAILKRKTENPLSPWIGSVTVMGNYIFFSQAIIIEVYALLAMFLAMSYALLVYNKPKLAAVTCGIAMGVHLTTSLIFFFAMVVSIKEFRRYVYIPIIVVVIISLLYGLLPRFYWDIGTRNNIFETMRVLWGALGTGGDSSSVYYGIFPAVKLLCVGFGLSLIPIIFATRKIEASAHLLFLLLIPVIYMIVGNWIYRSVQLVPFIPFAGVLAGIGVGYIRTSYLSRVVFASMIAMMISMPFFFDIGRTLDENPTTIRQLYNSLDDVKDGSLIISLRLFETDKGWVSDGAGNHVATVVEHHNSESGVNLVPVPLNFVWDENSANREKLIERGVNVPEFDERAWVVSEEEAYLYVMRTIADANPDRDVYYYRTVDKETGRCELVSLN